MPSPAARASMQLILDEAERCFAERGYSGTSLRQVAERAGVTQPLVSHYFGTKAQLFDEVLKRSVAEYEAIQGPQWAREVDDPDFVVAGLVVLFRWLGQKRHILRLMQWARLEGHALSTPTGLELWERIATRARSLVATGVLRADLDVDATLVLIDAAARGFWQRIDAYAREIPALLVDDEKDFERRMEAAFISTLIRGLFTPRHQARALKRWKALS